MKKIGFIDYYLSEWHANNYVAWLKEESNKHGYGFEVTHAWAELEVSPVDGVTTDEWCEKFGVTKCGSISELCEVSDVIIILSPDNPENHLRYAEAVLPFKKRTYIDKTFAPDYDTAVKIFDIAKKHGTPFFSTSALRFADELDAMDDVTHITTTGGGKHFEQYIIHQAEMVIKKIKAEPVSIVARKQGTSTFMDVTFEGGKTASILQDPSFPFSVCMSDATGSQVYAPVSSPFFKKLIADMVNFFETGETSFDTNETKQVIKLVEMCIKEKSTWH